MGRGEKSEEKPKLTPAEYKRLWRLRTGRTKQIGHRRGEDHPSSRLTDRRRRQAIGLSDKGWSNVDIGEHFGVSEGSIRKLLKQRHLYESKAGAGAPKSGGSVAASKVRRRPRLLKRGVKENK
jgi:hypothetical protein